MFNRLPKRPMDRDPSLADITITTKLGDVYQFPAMGRSAVRSMLTQLELDCELYENLALTNISQAVLLLKVKTIQRIDVDGTQRWPMAT